MAEKGFPGHEGGSNKPKGAPDAYNSPATHAPLADVPSPANTRGVYGEKTGSKE